MNGSTVSRHALAINQLRRTMTLDLVVAFLAIVRVMPLLD